MAATAPPPVVDDVITASLHKRDVIDMFSREKAKNNKNNF